MIRQWTGRWEGRDVWPRGNWRQIDWRLLMINTCTLFHVGMFGSERLFVLLSLFFIFVWNWKTFIRWINKTHWKVAADYIENLSAGKIHFYKSAGSVCSKNGCRTWILVFFSGWSTWAVGYWSAIKKRPSQVPDMNLNFKWEYCVNSICLSPSPFSTWIYCALLPKSVRI